MYLVAICDVCCRVALSEASVGACTCGRDRRIVPSCSYGSADLELFAELSQLASVGAISPLEAGRLSWEIESALATRNYDSIFERLSTRLPGLTPLQVLVARNPVAQRRALAMFRSITDALATAKRSGAWPAVREGGTLPDGQKRRA